MAREDTTVIRRNGIRYEIWDGFSNKTAALITARNARKVGVFPPKKWKTLAFVFDLGKNAGRLRYAVFVGKRKR